MTIPHSAVIVSISLLHHFFFLYKDTKESGGERYLAWSDPRPAGVQGISAGCKLPWCLLSWFQVTPPCGLAGLLLSSSVWRNTAENMVFSQSSVFVKLMRCLVCRAVELWSARGIENKETLAVCEPASPSCVQVNCPRPLWTARTIDVKWEWLQSLVRWLKYEICIEMHSSLSQTVFEILFSGDWWIDLDSQTRTNCAAPCEKTTPNRHSLCRNHQNDDKQAFQFAILFPSDQAMPVLSAPLLVDSWNCNCMSILLHRLH